MAENNRNMNSQQNQGQENDYALGNASYSEDASPQGEMGSAGSGGVQQDTSDNGGTKVSYVPDNDQNRNSSDRD